MYQPGLKQSLKCKSYVSWLGKDIWKTARNGFTSGPICYNFSRWHYTHLFRPRHAPRERFACGKETGRTCFPIRTGYDILELRHSNGLMHAWPYDSDVSSSRCCCAPSPRRRNGCTGTLPTFPGHIEMCSIDYYTYQSAICTRT